MWTDKNRTETWDGDETLVDQPTTFDVVNTYAVIVGQAQVVKSVTTSYGATVTKGVFTKISDTGAHGYSRSVTTVDYSFNGLGQMTGATGRTVGDQNSEVWSDKNRNNTWDADETVLTPVLERDEHVRGDPRAGGRGDVRDDEHGGEGGWDGVRD
ncbi:MAG: hypothetical protein IPN65_09425 [Elusimicrobia bacterium]|nr:hypothetical protein [Elusimicrobiota bacterium]